MARRKIISAQSNSDVPGQYTFDLHSYRELVDLLPQCVFETDENLCITYGNKFGFEFTGYTPEDLQNGLNVLDLVIPLDRERVRENVLKLIGEKRSIGNEYTALRKDGSTCPVNIFSMPILRDNKFAGLRGIVVDITRQKATEQALFDANTKLEQRVQERTAELLEANRTLAAEIAERKRIQIRLKQNEEKYRAVVEQSAECIFLVDIGTLQLCEANPAFQNLLGYPAEEIAGLKLLDFVTHTADSVKKYLKAVLQDGQTYIGERVYRKKDGTLIDVDVSASLVSYDGKNVFCAVARDIRQRKRQQKVQEVINQIGYSINTALNLDQLFQTIKRLLGQLLDTTHFLVTIQKNETDTSELSYYLKDPGTNVNVLPEKMLMEYVIRTGKSLLLNAENFEQQLKILDLQLDPNRLKSWLGVPLKLESRAFGALILQSYRESIQYSYDELVLLELISSHIAIAIHHRNAQEELAQIHAIYRAAIENTQGVPYRLSYGTNKYEIMGRNAEALLEVDFNEITPAIIAELQEKIIIFDERYKNAHKAYGQAFRRGEVSKYRKDFQIRTPIGKIKWLSDCAVPIKDEKTGQVIGSLGILQDITERKKIEDKLARIHDIYQQAIENARGAPYCLNYEEENYDFISTSAQNLLGMTALELTFDKVRQITKKIHILEPANLSDTATLKSAFLNGQIPIYRADMQIVTPGGEMKWLSDSSIPVKDEITGKVIGSLGILQDITERKQIEAALYENERRYRHVVEDQTDMIYRHLPDGTITFVNQACCHFMDQPKEKFLGQNLMAFVPTENQKLMREKLASLMPENPVTTYEHHIISPDGTSYWLHHIDRAIFNSAGKIKEFQSVARDITRRKETEAELEKYRLHLEELVLKRTQELADTNEKLNTELRMRRQTEVALRESKKRYKWLYQENPSMYFTINLKGIILSVNKYGAQQLGYVYSELIGKSVLDIIYQEDKPFIQNQLERMIQNNLPVCHWEFRKVAKNGQVMWVKEAARLIKNTEGKDTILIVCEDITDRIHTQKEKEDALTRLARAEKMVILGQLAGAITHEINNPLDIMMTEVDALAENFTNPEMANYTARIKKQIYRVHYIAKDVLSFSKDHSPQYERLELNSVVMESIDLIKNSLSDHIALEIHLTPNLPPLLGDAVGLEIVLKNILLNAMESILDQGRIRIATEESSNDFLTITIEDNGQGISKHDLKKIFDTFYTTKKATGGSGLGLKISAEILRQHKASINIKSKPGKGTTVQINLPIYKQN